MYLNQPTRNYKKLVFRYVFISLAVLVIADWIGDRVDIKWQFPIKIVGREVKNDPLQCPTSGVSEPSHIQLPEKTEEKAVVTTESWSGEASWYGASEEACLGCDPNFIMANGERLDDSKMTLAFNRLPLGSIVKVTNTKTGLSQVAEVTDTGGFEPLGRIADLSMALKDALGCGGLCDVLIETQEEVK